MWPLMHYLGRSHQPHERRREMEDVKKKWREREKKGEEGEEKDT